MSDEVSEIHKLTAIDVFKVLQTSPAGLSTDDVQTRFKTFGPNAIEVTVPLRRLKLILKHFTNPFSLLLYVSAALCFVAEAIQPGANMNILGFALAGVAILNGAFAFAQQYRAERAMEELRKFLPHHVTVRRGGSEITIVAEELVPGDVVLLREGDKIAADLRVVRSTDLLVNNAPLTGESRLQPLTDTAAAGARRESPNLAFAGCTILRGSGEAVVFATGTNTEFGRIATLSHQTPRPPSRLFPTSESPTGGLPDRHAALRLAATPVDGSQSPK